MNVFVSLAAVAVLIVVGYVGSGVGLAWVLGVAIPCAALVLFLGGVTYRVMQTLQMMPALGGPMDSNRDLRRR